MQAWNMQVNATVVPRLVAAADLHQMAALVAIWRAMGTLAKSVAVRID